MNEPVHIAFCFKSAFTPVAAVAICSALCATPGPVAVHVLSSDLTEANADALQRVVSAFPGGTLEIVRVDAEKFAAAKLTIPYISRETYFRFLLPELLPDVAKVLYLDADLVVRADLRPLYGMELGDAWLCGATDEWVVNDEDYPAKMLGLSPEEPYVNAGVLLFNLAAMRSARVSAALMAALGTLVPKVKFQDQDVLNVVCRRHVGLVDPAWNFTMCDWDRRKKERRGAKILHYTGQAKPWDETRTFPRPKAACAWQCAAARLRFVNRYGRPPTLAFEIGSFIGRMLRRIGGRP